jgi:hypothetical protein
MRGVRRFGAVGARQACQRIQMEPDSCKQISNIVRPWSRGQSGMAAGNKRKVGHFVHRVEAAVA